MHPLLQTNDSKHLIDIYFDVKNMETKKDENLKNEEIIIKFTKEKTALYLNVRNIKRVESHQARKLTLHILSVFLCFKKNGAEYFY